MIWDYRLNTMVCVPRVLLAAMVSVLAVLTVGCDEESPGASPSEASATSSDTDADVVSDGPEEAIALDSPAADITRAGLTVRLPNGCDPFAISAKTCSGLQSLRVETIGPLTDLIIPGVRRYKHGWVGLQTFDDRSYIFATADNRKVIADLLNSAQRQ